MPNAFFFIKTPRILVSIPIKRPCFFIKNCSAMVGYKTILTFYTIGRYKIHRSKSSVTRSLDTWSKTRTKICETPLSYRKAATFFVPVDFNIGMHMLDFLDHIRHHRAGRWQLSGTAAVKHGVSKHISITNTALNTSLTL